MNICFTGQGWDDYLYWQKTDKKILKKINELIRDVQRTPYEVLGKQPAQLDQVAEVGQQFFLVKGFGQVGISAAVQSLDAGIQIGPGG